MKYGSVRGFSLMEVILSVVILTVAGLGVYSLFNTGKSNLSLADAADQAVQIANVYTDLASSQLTTSDDDIPSLLKNSGRLSNKYFSLNSGVQIHNAFGIVTFSNVTPYSFVAIFPLSCGSGNVTSISSVPGQFFTKVQDVYSCDSSGSKDYASCAVTTCSHGQASTITLYFNMNH